jgi:hypothetical protein
MGKLLRLANGNWERSFPPGYHFDVNGIYRRSGEAIGSSLDLAGGSR